MRDLLMEQSNERDSREIKTQQSSERESIKCARYKQNNPMIENPKSARDTNVTLNEKVPKITRDTNIIIQ